jgi:hypothetical protein
LLTRQGNERRRRGLEERGKIDSRKISKDTIENKAKSTVNMMIDLLGLLSLQTN